MGTAGYMHSPRVILERKRSTISLYLLHLAQFRPREMGEITCLRVLLVPSKYLKLRFEVGSIPICHPNYPIT